MVVTEGEDGIKNEGEERQSKSKPCFFSIGFGKVDGDQNADNEVDEGDEEEEQPPNRATNNVEKDNDVVDGNQDGPARLTSFCEEDPHGGNHKQHNSSKANQKGHRWLLAAEFLSKEEHFHGNTPELVGRERTPLKEDFVQHYGFVETGVILDLYLFSVNPSFLVSWVLFHELTTSTWMDIRSYIVVCSETSVRLLVPVG